MHGLKKLLHQSHPHRCKGLGCLRLLLLCPWTRLDKKACILQVLFRIGSNLCWSALHEFRPWRQMCMYEWASLEQLQTASAPLQMACLIRAPVNFTAAISIKFVLQYWKPYYILRVNNVLSLVKHWLEFKGFLSVALGINMSGPDLVFCCDNTMLCSEVLQCTNLGNKIIYLTYQLHICLFQNGCEEPKSSFMRINN